MDYFGKLGKVYFIESTYQIICVETPHGEFCPIYFNFYSFLCQFSQAYVLIETTCDEQFCIGVSPK